MKWIVTGGVGFIGTNVVEHLLENGHEVVVVDDLSRDGVRLNAQYLEDAFGIRPNIVDVSDRRNLWSFLETQGNVNAVAHLAGQVSLLASIKDPLRDFQVNAEGTLNILEYYRRTDKDVTIIGMSSNKAYGDLAQIPIVEEATRFRAPDWPDGFDESLPLDFHGPYGCSKGLADQYLADYARTFGMRSVSFRQSSVYGPHQHPRSDQGWVAHLVEEALHQRDIQLNGIGKQVRDLLHARDLARLIELVGTKVGDFKRHQFNIGGGASNSMSILELFAWIEAHAGFVAHYQTGAERPSDQKVFVANTDAIGEEVDWEPAIPLQDGLEELVQRIEHSRT